MLPAGGPAPGTSQGRPWEALNQATAPPWPQETGPDRKQPQEETHPLPSLAHDPTRTSQGNMATTPTGVQCYLRSVSVRVHSCHIQEYGLYFTTCQRKKPVQSPHKAARASANLLWGGDYSKQSSALPAPSQISSGNTRRHICLVRLLCMHETAMCTTWGTQAAYTETRGGWGNNRSTINMGFLTLGAPKSVTPSILPMSV